MKVIICESKKGSWFAPIYTLFMGGQTAYPHGMIWNNGKLYDTTFFRGRFGEVKSIADNRTVIVFDVEGDCQEWINNNLGAKYDWLGVILWTLGIHVEQNFHCYQIIQRILLAMIVTGKHLQHQKL